MLESNLPPRSSSPVLEPNRPSFFVTACVALAVVGVILGCGFAIAWLFDLNAVATPSLKNPFGVGIREGGGNAQGLAGWFLGLQSRFYRLLTETIQPLASGGTAVWTLGGLSFAYGIFHAAGPGHGKAVISAWIVAHERTLRRGLVLSFAAAMLQAGVAVVLVSLLAGLLHVTSTRMTAVTQNVEFLSFLGITLTGAWLLWRKSTELAAHLFQEKADSLQEVRASCGVECSHGLLPDPSVLEHSISWKETLGVIVGAGLRPCSGALIVLIFALSKGAYVAGVTAVFMMGLGTALTTGLLATLAVFAKASALRFAQGRGNGAALGLKAFEAVIAGGVLVFGATLATGLAPFGMGS